jgi:hypothetical protein
MKVYLRNGDIVDLEKVVYRNESGNMVCVPVGDVVTIKCK